MTTETMTHALVTDITPSRATVLAVGSFDDCREAIEDADPIGQGQNVAVAVIAAGVEVEVGSRPWVRGRQPGLTIVAPE